MTTALKHLSQALTLLAIMAASVLIGVRYVPDQCEDVQGKRHVERLTQ